MEEFSEGKKIWLNIEFFFLWDFVHRDVSSGALQRLWEWSFPFIYGKRMNKLMIFWWLNKIGIISFSFEVQALWWWFGVLCLLSHSLGPRILGLWHCQFVVSKMSQDINIQLAGCGKDKYSHAWGFL